MGSKTKGNKKAPAKAKAKKKISKPAQKQKTKAMTKRKTNKGDGLGSKDARSKNAKFFSSFLPSGGFSLGLGSLSRSKVKKSVLDYEEYHKFENGKSVNSSKAKSKYADMVNKYYDLATSFYEYAWGDCFHFAHRLKGETLRESIKRHEHFLASKFTAGMKPKKGQRPKVLDVGCGIGGPAREISAFCGVDVVGLNNNAYQVQRAKDITAAKREAAKDAVDAAGPSVLGSCDFVRGDFMKMPFEDNTFDAAYAIEATCHAPVAEEIYKEMLRVVKPGGHVAIYEWCLTDKYDPKDESHKLFKHQIEIGNGLPDIRTTRECKQAMQKAGFQVVEDIDLADCSPVPWYEPLYPTQGYFSSLEALSSIKSSPVGAKVTHGLCWVLESLRLAPKGTCRVSSVLQQGAIGLIAGGKLDAFTPMYCLVGRKPSK
ncbi:cycloartenol-C-24-methyltransferase [Chloropicon roscoffensis]|uniref:Methyltransferase n=1 Tax=Chloropicon roscoffensis TaxID=1461544 RepID=A0AAX4P546_9CHLO